MELALELNADTGEFSLYINNVDLDDRNPTLNADVNIQLDDVVAESIVTFKNISRRKHDHR